MEVIKSVTERAATLLDKDNGREGARRCTLSRKLLRQNPVASPESKNGLSLYRSLNTKVYSGPGGRAQQLHSRYLFPSFCEASLTETLMKLGSGRNKSYHFF